MPATMHNTLPALVKAVRPFANKSRRVPALHDACVTSDGGTTRVQATDLEIACTVAACTPGVERGVMLLDSASAEPVTERDPRDFPAVGRLAGETLATFTLDARDVRRIAENVAVACDDESSRYALGGVLIEGQAGEPLVAVATDGRRMHCARIAAAEATGRVPLNCIVPWRLFGAFGHAVRTAVAAVTGAKGRRLDAAVADAAVTLTVTATAVRLAWATDTLSVEADACIMQGRFPRWRDILPAAAAGIENPRDAPSLARWCREVVKATDAARGAALDRIAAEAREAHPGPAPAAFKARAARRAAANYLHPRGVQFSADGAAACGCDMVAGIPFRSRTRLDPAFLADSLDAAVAFGGCDEVALRVDTPQAAVTVAAGGWAWGGPGFLAVIMPIHE